MKFAFVVLALAWSAADARAQAASETPPKVTATLSNVTRVESWSFFQPRRDLQAAEPVDPEYTYMADRAQLGVRVEGRRFDIASAFNYVRLENLPAGAIGPGALGSGAFYFAATEVPFSYQLYMSELNLVAKSTRRGLSTQVGRMRFESGAEVASSNASVETLKRERLQSRMIGTFESSLYQRRFDGLRVDWDRPRWHVSSSLLLPTQGGYEESANLTMPNVRVLNASFTAKWRTAESQVFSHVYRDRRDVSVRPDNTGLRVRAADVTVAAIGASHAGILPTAAGELDIVGWFAAEFGDWFGQSHRAGSVVGEAGHRWTRTRMRPWIRGGFLFASGDDDPRDDTHATFFQMLPSSPKYALSAVYAQMNLRDGFFQVELGPGRGTRTRVEVHRLDLARGEDRWYYGSGATASTGRFFGFAGRFASNETSLGTVVEGTFELPLKRYWSVEGYAGTMWGGPVVRGLFQNDRLTTWYVENRLHW